MRWRPDGTALALAVIFAVALALRVAWLAETDTVAPPLSDPQYYHATAQNLAEGRGYSVAVDERGFVAGDASESTAFWPPGYPFALAGAHAIFGDDERNGQWLNALAGALTVVPVFFIGRHLTPRPVSQATLRPLRQAEKGRSARGDRTGLLAAAIFSLMPSLVYWTASLFSEPLFALGVATTIALVLRAASAPDHSAVRWGIAVGVVLGATALVRSQGLVLIVPVAILLLRRPGVRPAVRALAPVVAACALFVVPWTLRNAAVMGEPYVINDNLCYNLRGAHAPYSTGGSVAPQDLWDERPGISFGERELLFDEIGCERAWEYAREHPGRELDLSARRIGWLLRSDAAPAIDWSQSLGRTPLQWGDADVYALAGDVYWYPMLVLAALSLVVVPRTRSWCALWSLLLCWVALHVVFHGEPRYHVPMTPVLAALASATMASNAGGLRRRGVAAHQDRA
jgi:4-amino-4-deoxy-L-arabinose transferase-like glycosyltransferase